jgi:Kdo2-lipid IVA lauroyltransferase/acyltransferase
MVADGGPVPDVKRRTRNRILVALLRTAGALVRLLPLTAAQRIGSVIGRPAWYLSGRNRTKALRSLERAFPELTEEERLNRARASFRHLGTSLMEVAWMPNLDRKTLRATTEWIHLDQLERAATAGRGVILFTGHCGNWEWMASAIALEGFEMNVIAREIDETRFNDYIVAARSRFGVETIGRGSESSAREIIRTLRSGKILGVLIDQNIRTEVVRVPFFGHDAPTPIGPAKLAVRSGAMVIAGFIERHQGRHRIRFEQAIDTTEIRDPVEITRRMTEAIEDQIRRVPEQWVWMHDRWRPRSSQREYEP